MARERSPNRDKAFEIYKSHNGNILLKYIATELSVSEGTVRGWKNKDSWDKTLNGTLQKNKRNAPKKDNNKSKLDLSDEAKCKTYNHDSSDSIVSGQKTNTRRSNARPGNKNALGNKGGLGGPLGNKKAVTTGEFETIFFDTLEEDELELIDKTPFEKMELLKQEIQLLTVRERRMLKRVSNLKEKEVVLESETHGTQGDGNVSISNYESTLNVIQRIEDALTRVQDKKQKAIDTLHKFEMDGLKANIDKEKLELEKYKTYGDDESDNSDAIQSFLKATTMSEGDIKALFDDEGDEDGTT
ncbi:MAG: phage terminase small subunit-related protein [Paraclostridium sp.]